MTVTVFLDTNIVQSDFKMESSKFINLFDATKEIKENEKFWIYITEMNEHELLENYNSELNTIYKKFKEYYEQARKLLDVDKLPRKKDWKARHVEDFKNNLQEHVEIYIPSSEVDSKAIQRFYSGLRPHRDNKEEFKDAIIWESVFEYAEENPDETIYFISKNTTEFAQHKEEYPVRLHSEYNDLNGRIKYIKNLTDFLKEIEFLKIYHFDFREQEEILTSIKNHIGQNYNEDIEWAMHSFFSNRDFQDDYLIGWGSDPYLNKVISIEITDEENVLERDGHFVIPVILKVEIDYCVEAVNPVYEPGDDDEFLQSDTLTDFFEIMCDVNYDAQQNEVIEVSDIGFM